MRLILQSMSDNLKFMIFRLQMNLILIGVRVSMYRTAWSSLWSLMRFVILLRILSLISRQRKSLRKF